MAFVEPSQLDHCAIMLLCRELTNIGITVPTTGISKAGLKGLYLENVDNPARTRLDNGDECNVTGSTPTALDGKFLDSAGNTSIGIYIYPD